MRFLISIENIGGVFYINGKRLGHDDLSEAEKNFINEFFKEFKIKEKENEPV